MNSPDPRSLFLLAILLFCFAVPAIGQQVTLDRELSRAFPDLPKLKDPGKPVQLVYKPEKGDQWLYRLKVNTDIDIMGMEMPKYDEVLVRLKINSADENGFEFTSSIAEMIAEMNTRGGSIRVDSVNPEKERADAPFRPLLKMWQKVREATLTCRSTTQGNVENFEVPQGVKDAVDDQNGAFGVSPTDLAANFVIGIVTLPEQPVSVGDQWEMETVVVPLAVESSTQTATFVGVGMVDGVEVAGFQVEFHAESEEKRGMVSDIQMSTTSLILFDLEAGNVRSSYIVAEGEMVIHTGANELLQTSKGISTLERITE